MSVATERTITYRVSYKLTRGYDPVGEFDSFDELVEALREKLNEVQAVQAGLPWESYNVQLQWLAV